MKKAVATEVIVTQYGLVVIGSRGPGTRIWFRPANKTRASERLSEFIMPFEPPRESPAALLPSGKLLVVGRNCQSLTVEVDRSPQPGPVIANAVLEGLSPDGVAFARGPQFFRYVDGAWVNEGPAEDPKVAKLSITEQIAHRMKSMRGVNSADQGLAVGADGDAWLGPKWKKLALKTKATLRCVSGGWVGGDGVVLERKGKVFKAHKVKGSVTSICAWKKGALLVIDGQLFDLKGTQVKAPPELTSVSAFGDFVCCISRGGLFESTDARQWHRKSFGK